MLSFEKKGAKGEAINIFNALKVFLKRMKQKRPLEKKFTKFYKIKKKMDNIFSFKFF